VTRSTIDKVFPMKDELALLCHVREVDVNDTELANGDDDGFLATVIANRPAAVRPQPTTSRCAISRA
jgi:hypothetical protein